MIYRTVTRPNAKFVEGETADDIDNIDNIDNKFRKREQRQMLMDRQNVIGPK
jgi:hypothetical protein